MTNIGVRISHYDPVRFCTVEVPNEDGRIAIVDFYRHREGFWTVDISEELIATCPEGLTAALGMAFREMRDLYHRNDAQVSA